MHRSAVAAALGLTVLASALSGCGADDAGAAATIDGNRIPVSEVQDAVTDLSTFTGQPITQQDALFLLLVEPAVTQAADAAGVGVSADDARVQFENRVASPSEGAIVAMRASGALTKINNLGEDRAKPVVDSILKTLRAANIDVSPRFGSFDPNQLLIVPAQEDWIKPSPSGSASAGAEQNQQSPEQGTEQTPAPETGQTPVPTQAPSASVSP